MAREIPIIPTVLLTYRLTFSSFLYAIKISWIWFALVALVLYVATIWLGDQMTSLSTAILTPGTDPALIEINRGAFLLTFLAFFTLFAIGWASVAVLWHRHLLEGEEKAGVPAEVNSRMFTYLRRFIVIGLILVLVMLGIMLIYGPISLALLNQHVVEVDGKPTIPFSVPAVMLQLFLSSILYGVIGVVFTRLGLSLPAIALDNTTFTIGDGLKASAGSNGRLFAIHVLMFLPILLLELVIAPGTPNSLMPEFLGGSYTLAFLSVAYYLFITLLSVTLLSVLYRYLVQQVPYEQVF